MRSLWARVYADFLMPPRLKEYETLLRTARDAGYEFHSIRSFYEMVQRTHPLVGKHVVLRHDIDTDVHTARQMWEEECRAGARSTSYFRLSTLDISLMQEIEASGCEAGYHYEEIATIAKRRLLRTGEDVVRNMPEIKATFCENLSRLRMATGLPIVTVASHGDFVNRMLSVRNVELMTEDVRKLMGIWAEAYDESINRYVTVRHSDTLYPRFWMPSNPFESIHSGENVVLVLTHPRHWQVARAENLRDNLVRLSEGLSYRIRTPR